MFFVIVISPFFFSPFIIMFLFGVYLLFVAFWIILFDKHINIHGFLYFMYPISVRLCIFSCERKKWSYFSMSFLPLSLCNGIKLSEKYQNTEKKANRNYDVFISNVMNSSLAYMLRLLFKLYSLLALFEKHFSYETLCAYCSPEIR